MKITVAIPVYNRVNRISYCIDSVLEQKETSDFSYAVLVVDNASTDGTKEVLEKYDKENNKVNVIYNQTNLGMAGNWTKCFEKAEADYIYLLHSDDVMLKDALQTIASFLNKHPKCDFGFGNVDVNRNGKVTKNVFSIKNKNFEILDNNWLLDKYFYRASHPCPPQTWFIKKGVIENLGGFIKDNICCDFNMSFKIVASNYKVGYINQSLAEWVIHDDNAGGGDMSKHKSHLIKAIEEIKDRSSEFNLDKRKVHQLVKEVNREEAFYYLKFGNNKKAQLALQEFDSKKQFFNYSLDFKDYFIKAFKHTRINFVRPLYIIKQYLRV